jgi:hypothetical protein
MFGNKAERACCVKPVAARRCSCAESVERLFCSARLIASVSDNCAGAAEVLAAPGKFCLISEDGSNVDDGKLPTPGIVRTSGIGLLLESELCGATVCCALVGVRAGQKSETKKPLKTEENNLSRLRLLPLNRTILYSPIAPQKSTDTVCQKCL